MPEPTRYPLSTKAFDVDNIFRYHGPFGDQAERYVRLREEAKGVAELIQLLTPPSREQSLALTNLQQAIMWANAAIAINERPPVTPEVPAAEAPLGG